MARKSENRRKNGTYGPWRGGKHGESHHGAMVKIGIEYKRQTGRKAKVGDVVRRKNLNGSYNKGSPWYVKTPHGWRPIVKKRRN